MVANTTIAVTSLDFDDIVDSIKSYISATSEFKDYNFEGSVINMLIKILAYNTYQNAFYVSMIGNEMFLDSAQLRESIVSRAKMLGYTPLSERSAYTTMNITYDSTAVSVTIPRGTVFNVEGVNGASLRFITQDSYILYSAENYTKDIIVYEGYDTTESFTIDTSIPIRYKLSNQNIDTTSILVNVRDFLGSSKVTRYILANNINEVTNTSNVYFLQEIENGQFEIYFGDGILGTAPITDNIVEITYRVTEAEEANDILTTADWAAGNANITINTVGLTTTGGTPAETNDSIKYNAPKSFETQNRAVVKSDYERLILRENGNIVNSLRVWGGEENLPPIYGKVFISVQPAGSATILSSTQKTLIRNNIKQYNTMAIDVEFIDASYIYIIPTITVYYNSTLTTDTADQIASAVATTVTTYETNKLGKFINDKFHYSEFLRAIDDTDQSIAHNVATFVLEKRFKPILNSSVKYTINCGQKLLNKTGVTTLSSTSFTAGGETLSYLDDDSAGNVRLYYVNTNGDKVYTDNTFGTIDYTTGIIILNTFTPTATPASDGIIRIMVLPDGYDLNVNKSLLLLFGDTVITVIDETAAKSTAAITVSTTGSVTQINETSIGTPV